MKIIVEHSADEENYGQYEGLTTTVVTDNGSKTASFRGGEPEDFTLSRDLRDACHIKDMLVLAYNAGKNGESLEIEETSDLN
jgi:hypothetical protein